MNADMTIMAWDTATSATSAAIVRVSAEGRFEPLAAFEQEGGPSHSQILPPQMAALLASAGLTPRDLTMVAVGRGPGSFTGLRTALALAKGLAMGAGLPIMGISTLEALAAHMIFERGAALAAPVIDARHQEIFTALYRPAAGAALELECLIEPQPAAPKAFAALLGAVEAGGPIAVAGNGLNALPPLPPGAAAMAPPGNIAVMLARLAARHLKKEGNALSANPPLPLYIRQPDIRRSGIVL